MSNANLPEDLVFAATRVIELAYRQGWVEESEAPLDEKTRAAQDTAEAAGELRDAINTALAALSARVAKLEAEQSEARNRVARLEAALRFYAEPSGYLLGLRFRPVVVDDGGMRARAALEDKS